MLIGGGLATIIPSQQVLVSRPAKVPTQASRGGAPWWEKKTGAYGPRAQSTGGGSSRWTAWLLANAGNDAVWRSTSLERSQASRVLGLARARATEYSGHSCVHLAVVDVGANGVGIGPARQFNQSMSLNAPSTLSEGLILFLAMHNTGQ